MCASAFYKGKGPIFLIYVFLKHEVVMRTNDSSTLDAGASKPDKNNPDKGTKASATTRRDMLKAAWVVPAIVALGPIPSKGAAQSAGGVQPRRKPPESAGSGVQPRRNPPERD